MVDVENIAYRIQKDYEKYLIYTCKKALSISKSRTGQTGSAGSDAKTVKLTSSGYAIAYDENNSEFWITGKYWPHIFQITLEERDILIESDSINNTVEENDTKINERFVDSNSFVISIMILLMVGIIIWTIDLKIRDNSEKTQVQELSGEYYG